LIAAGRAAARALPKGRPIAGRRFPAVSPALPGLFALLVALATAGSLQPASAAQAGGGATAEGSTSEHPTLARAGAALAPVTAVAVGVDDGDSFVARRSDGAKIRVRIAGIDAPEKSQPWAGLARQRLRALLVGREVRIVPLKTDPWGRHVALVEVDGKDSGLAMIEDGLAWHFTRYDRDLPPPLRPRYAQAESLARERRVGLWQAPEPEPPWVFRKRNPR